MHESKSQETKTLWAPMLEPEIVKQIRALTALGWGKNVSPASWASRVTACGYLREGEAADTQT